MKNLIGRIMSHYVSRKQPRLRDRRGHYASSAFTDLRDQYWAATGVPETNRADFLGKMKMLVGSAVEHQLIKEIFSDLHWVGIHLDGTQVSVGGSKPDWDGNMDVLLKERDETGKLQGYVVEIKTKSGYGADMLKRELNPSKEYLAQLGLYLRDMWQKEGVKTGCLFYVLLSDKAFGEILQFHCVYDEVLDVLRCVGVEGSHFEKQELSIKLDMQEVLKRYEAVDKAVAEKKEPKGEYPYKFPLTEELLSSTSDDKLRKMMRGELILGPWQPKYSRYKNKILATDKVALTYAKEEVDLIRKEYRTRYPGSKI